MEQNIKIMLGSKHQSFQLVTVPNKEVWTLFENGDIVMIGTYTKNPDKSAISQSSDSLKYFRNELFLEINDLLFGKSTVEKLNELYDNAWVKANMGESTKEFIEKIEKIPYHNMSISFDVFERRGDIYLGANECEVRMSKVIDRLASGNKLDIEFLEMNDVLR